MHENGVEKKKKRLFEFSDANGKIIIANIYNCIQ